jgi:hypothetical protein
MRASGAICAYCGEPVLTGDERPEHPVPRALGSSLEVFTVCDPCNTWAGREIDQPFLDDDWVRIHRSLHDVRDPDPGRSRPIPSPLFDGFTEDGVRVTLDADGHPRLHGRIIDNGDDSFRIIAGTPEHADRLRERVRRRAETEGRTTQTTSEGRSRLRPAIISQISLGFVVWARMAAKIALGVASDVFPEEWRSGPDAAALRAQVRDENPRSPTGEPMGLVPGRLEPDNHLRNLVSAPEHALWFARLGDGSTALSVLLFGELIFGQRVDSTGLDVPEVAWKLNPRRPDDDGRTTFRKLVDDAVRRIATPLYRND